MEEKYEVIFPFQFFKCRRRTAVVLEALEATVLVQREELDYRAGGLFNAFKNQLMVYSGEPPRLMTGSEAINGPPGGTPR
jgi:hypothetical protein